MKHKHAGRGKKYAKDFIVISGLYKTLLYFVCIYYFNILTVWFFFFFLISQNFKSDDSSFPRSNYARSDDQFHADIAQFNNK